ncbi:DNA-directed RNA polymerase subunit beta [Thomasclavelia cocleata]|uniref:DNA-directed RNA polymerase subunit beta n=1 Tax=Thomasclavelia cocleata TaxID=69824 RepID=A0A1I0H8Y0_9FIRM|nr:DNA-directed RNA polymerase subunit beta [Thomasclavelia cocleata]MCR1961863.1 DNA-directed RNA polymerase subunit beta [Thomasclavelia cocleata]NDO42124.1 DNA-directed RNA polymerase subunit beta [Thomasclavelia cocleata]PJN80162.1 DNA-directed RNA polymerase subunit beta [Thomasclavelia cocleata]SET80079.1 DNA-directed RNA polymerase subunit beta [Thomasclavelia cocleata]
MENKITKAKSKITRRNYSRISGSLELPNLVEIQTNSYKWFKEVGIKEVFEDIYPITNFNETLSLEFVDCTFDEAKYSVEESKDRDANYAAPIRASLRLVNSATGEIKEQEVFMGDFPLMTDSGTFIINGAERVIVSQLVRSPGAYFADALDKSGKTVFNGSIIPSRGTWLEFENDAKDILNVRIDRNRKMPGTVLLRALGLSSNDEIIDVFGEHEFIINTLAKDNTTNMEEALIEIYNKLRPGEPATLEGANNLLFAKFFDNKRYDLAKAGRFKFRKKLSLLDRISGRILAQDLVDINGNMVYPKGTLITQEIIDVIKPVLEAGAHTRELNTNPRLESNGVIQVLDVYVDDIDSNIMRVIGTDLSLDSKFVTISDMIAAYSYMFNLVDIYNSLDLTAEDRVNLMARIGLLDDIDHLGNRRVRSVGELIQNQFRIGLSRMERVVKERMSLSEVDSITPQSLTNIRPLTAAIKEFFSSSQLSQFMDQINPLAELTNKRRLSALGPGGLSRDRAGYEVRDVHASHYGRICPIETPEGPNIGLISTLASYAKINQYGFIETPYRKVNNCVIDEDDVRYLTADEEKNYIIAQANVKTDKDGTILDSQVIARHLGENIMAKREEVDFIDISPKQIVSVATSCIPFLENDDATRALMGANMQRQAVPLLNPHTPFVGTGMEHQAARDSGAAVVAREDGIITYVDAKKVVVEDNEGVEHRYRLAKFKISNNGTCINHKPIVKMGEKVLKGQVLADGPAMEQGELALGQNVLVGFMEWNGYNYEDAVIMSERLVKDDVYTSIHIDEYAIECRDTKLGPEEITRDIPNVGDEARKNLNSDGIIMIGAEVKEGDILVGKVTPKGQAELSAEEKLLLAIFGEKSREVKDNSLRVPHGGAGIVHDIKVFERKNGDELQPGVNKVVKVYIVQKRKISEGDKMAGRHGNKGVISKILPIEDMPHLEDGTPLDIMLNPLGVPSRMNIGQVLELHLGYAARQLGLYIATPAFDGLHPSDLEDIMAEAGMSKDGKQPVISGRTGEYFDNNISVGIMYMIKLAHMVDDKLHARSVGPYSLVTQQPLGGKAQNGGQRFGEMEVWALEAYGAAYTLREILTVKSDDVVGRVKTYEAIVKGQPLPEPGLPESFRVLKKELQALALDIRLLDENDNEVDMRNIEEEEHRFPRSIDKDEVIETPKTDEQVEEEIDEDDLEIEENCEVCDEDNFEDDNFEGDDIEESESL